MSTLRRPAADEETPLLQSTKSDDRTPQEETPIPWAQFSIVLFLQFAEPLTSQVIYPFLPQVRRAFCCVRADSDARGSSFARWASPMETTRRSGTTWA